MGKSSRPLSVPEMCACGQAAAVSRGASSLLPPGVRDLPKSELAHFALAIAHPGVQEVAGPIAVHPQLERRRLAGDGRCRDARKTT